MFHFFAQTEPKKQPKGVGDVFNGVVITSGGGQKQKATTEKSPLRRLVATWASFDVVYIYL